jgi:hypothetical protein
MSRLVALIVVAGCCAVACERPAERTKEREFAAKVLSGLLAYPRSSVVDVSAGSDAAQVTLATPAPVQEVATWYRQMLRLNGWDLVNDGVMGDGSVSIYAEKGKRPVWVTLRATAGGAGTTYTLIGAQLPQDSAAAPTPAPAPPPAQRSGSSMSSNRIQRR